MMRAPTHHSYCHAQPGGLPRCRRRLGSGDDGSLEAIAERFRSNPNLMEKLCRCYKHAMRSCNVHFAPMLPKMIAHLVQSFSKAPHCSFLYAGSICITEFGNVREYVPVLFDMIQNFSGIVFQNLQSIEQFTANPDMVEEYFYLVARFISYCPDPLLQSPMLASVLQCGVIGLRLEHREALPVAVERCGGGGEGAAGFAPSAPPEDNRQLPRRQSPRRQRRSAADPEADVHVGEAGEQPG